MYKRRNTQQISNTPHLDHSYCLRSWVAFLSHQGNRSCPSVQDIDQDGQGIKIRKNYFVHKIIYKITFPNL